jgi:2',3'-cyclic-nucleotide 2'-phosphodiesterase (5'-nucleotidase family)
LKGKEIVEALRALNKIMVPKLASGKTDWLSINVFNNCVFDESATRALMKVHKSMVGFFVAIADVGLTPIQSAGMQLSDSLIGSAIPLKFADTVDEAKEWVVEVHRKTVKKGQ